MDLFKLTHARIFAGGGYKNRNKKSSRMEDNVVLQLEKGGVKLDKALTRDRL